jgi:hypothetical protein
MWVDEYRLSMGNEEPHSSQYSYRNIEGDFSYQQQPITSSVASCGYIEITP